MSEGQEEVVLSIPSALLYQVQGSAQSLLADGQLLVKRHAGTSTILVGQHSWALGKQLPCLRSDTHTFTFAITAEEEGQPLVFYCAILSKDTLPSDLQLLESVLAASTAFSNTDPTAGEGLAGAQDPRGSEPSPGALPGSSNPGEGTLEDTSSNTSATSSSISEQLKKGASVLGSRFSWAVQRAGAGLSAAKEKAAAGITPETRAKLEAAREAARNKWQDAGVFASRVALDFKSAASKLADKVAESETVGALSRGDSLRNLSAASKTMFSTVYREMQLAGESVMRSIHEASVRVRARADGQEKESAAAGAEEAARLGQDPPAAGFPASQAEPPAPGQESEAAAAAHGPAANSDPAGAAHLASLALHSMSPEAAAAEAGQAFQPGNTQLASLASLDEVLKGEGKYSPSAH